MRYILVMSVAGSLLLLFYCFTNNKKVTLFSNKLQDVLLKGALFYYLFPLGFLTPLYREVLYCLPKQVLQDDTIFFEYSYYYAKMDGKLYFSTDYKLQIVLFIIWFLVALIVQGIQILRYLKNKKHILAASQLITEGLAHEILEQVRQELNVKRRIRLYDTKNTAFTMGVLRPVICLNSEMDRLQLEMTLRHECAHIHRWDVLTRQLISLATSVHWFNPAVYFLTKKAEKLFEICCDEAVITGMDKLQKKAYAQMLVENTGPQPMAPVFYSALSEDATSMEERIMNIMKPKTRTKLQTALAVLLLSIVFYMDSWTVLAYPEAIDIGIIDYTMALEEEVVFVKDGAEGPFDVPEYTFVYENQFVDADGKVYPIYEEGVSTMDTHTHVWVSGQRQTHQKNADGSCIVYVYAAERCSVCGVTVAKELLSKTTYTSCPH